jgi:hypothetical protein
MADAPDRGRGGRQALQARVLRMLPPLIAALWIAGIANFRDFGFGPLDYLTLLAAALALQLVLGRMRGSGRPIVLPASSNPTTIALLAAAMTAALAIVLGGIVEALVPALPGHDLPPWALRTLWHGACAFGASYCRFLSRLLPSSSPPPA